MNNGKGTWLLGTVVVAVLMMIATYFLLVSPNQATAGELRTDAENREAQNLLLTTQVAQLRADFAKIDDYRDELAQLRQGIPSTAELASYVETIGSVAQAAGVTVVSVVPQAPMLVAMADPAAAPTQPVATDGSVSTEASAEDDAAAEGEDAVAEGDAEGDAEAAPQPSAGVDAPAGFTAVPVTMTVLGPYDGVLAFLDNIQHASRLFLVASMNGSGQRDADAQGGLPATKLGDLQLEISGFLYVLPGGDTATVDGEDGEDGTEVPPPFPGATPGKNPWVPVQGAVPEAPED